MTTEKSRVICYWCNNQEVDIGVAKIKYRAGNAVCKTCKECQKGEADEGTNKG